MKCKFFAVIITIAFSCGQLKSMPFDEHMREQILFVANKLSVRDIFCVETNTINASFVIKGATNFIMKLPPHDRVVTIDVCGNIAVKGCDGMVLASGMCFNAEEAPNVRAALIGELVKGTIPLECVAEVLCLSSESIGEFVLGEAACDNGEKCNKNRVVHFIRLGNVISLYAENEVDDIRPIAKALDDYIVKQAAQFATTNATNSVSVTNTPPAVLQPQTKP